jgi:hypothetical protein
VTAGAGSGKPPLGPLPLDLEAHARFATTIAVLLSVAAIALAAPSMGETMWLDGFIVAVFLGSAAFSIFVVAGTFWLLARGWRRILDRYSAGGYLADWTYGEAQWREHLARGGRRMRTLTLLFIAAFALAGLAVAWQMQADDDMIFSDPALNYLVLALAGAAFGALVSAVFALGRRYTRHRLGKPAPRCIVGWDGFHIGGELVPIRSVWQRALAMSLHGGEHPRIDVLMRVVTGNAVIRRTDVVPVPPGREAEARDVIKALGF